MRQRLPVRNCAAWRMPRRRRPRHGNRGTRIADIKADLKNAQSLLRYYRPGNPELQDPQLQKALRVVEASPEAKAALATQVEFDDRQADIIRSITPDEEFLNKIDDKVEALQKGFQWSALRQPPFLAGALALLVVIGVMIYFGMAWMQDFPGKETAEQMIDMTEEMTGIELEPKVTEAGMLEDWFFSNGYENFRMLPAFAHMKTVGCRVFQQEVFPVAQIAPGESQFAFLHFPLR